MSVGRARWLSLASPGMCHDEAGCTPRRRHTARVDELSWEDRTPFEALQAMYGLDEAAVIARMRQQSQPGSSRLWRVRVRARKTKHTALRPAGLPWVWAIGRAIGLATGPGQSPHQPASELHLVAIGGSLVARTKPGARLAS
jgi:uncharacterized protein (TIGR03643 family)